MAGAFDFIPIIDISALVEKADDPDMAADKGVAEVVLQLDKACREAGFFYVKGHGIPDSLLEEVRSISREFFNSPMEEKLKMRLTKATGYRGYQRVGDNTTEGVPDIHEAITCYREVKPGMYGSLGEVIQGCNQWPSNPPNLKSLMEKYVDLCTDLSRKIMRGIALALGGPVDMFEGKVTGDPFWVLRIIGYPVVCHANGKETKKEQDDIGCGAHTDKGLLGLINQDLDTTALQVRNNKGEWISAIPIPGTFVCNIGDMLQILTNGLYESTLHRVMNNSPKYRVCVAYFYEANFDVVVEPLDLCTQKSGGTKKFQGVMYGKHLVEIVQTNFIA